KMLTKLTSLVRGEELLTAMAAEMPRGCRGLAHLQPPHILDAMDLLKEVWEELTQQTISNCFSKAGILPEAQDADVPVDEQAAEPPEPGPPAQLVEMLHALRSQGGLDAGTDTILHDLPHVEQSA